MSQLPARTCHSNSANTPSSHHLKMTNQSAKRNSEPILAALRQLFCATTPHLRAVDTASGTGQHCAYIAPHFPNICFQPSEFDRRMLPSISAYAADCTATRNVCPAMWVDVQQPLERWGRNDAAGGPYLDGSTAGPHRDMLEYAGDIDYMLNINMIHITPIECTRGLFANAGRLLRAGGLLVTYGAYGVDGRIEPESNRVFDGHLKQMDARFGVRDLGELTRLAEAVGGLVLEQVLEMPANNKVCAWRKVAASAGD